MTKSRIFLFLVWLFIPTFCKSQIFDSPAASLVFPRIENTSYDNWFICKNPAFTSCIDTRTQLPLWVSHAITGERIQYGDTIKRKRPGSPGYIRDNRYKILKSDAYAGSGYDHGHMAPAADFKWDADRYRESFLMTNMAPQHGCLNQKGWCHIEAQCRKWAVENPGNTVYIVAGIIPGTYRDTLCISKKLTVYVPENFYKAVLLYNPSGDDSKAIGFVMNNSDISMTDVMGCIVTIDEIEDLTALDLFSLLPDDLEEEIESETGDLEITTTTLDCPDKDCEAVYSGNRKPPEERTKLRCNR